VKGDSKYYSIAAASIIAKQHHDMHIRELIELDPTLDTKYGLSSNMGYPTKAHMDGVKKYGASEYHRKTFKGVKNI
jgi:ribonuclease HII